MSSSYLLWLHPLAGSPGLLTVRLLVSHGTVELLVSYKIGLHLCHVLTAQRTGEGARVGLYASGQQKQVLSLQAGEAGRVRLGWQGTGAG